MGASLRVFLEPTAGAAIPAEFQAVVRSGKIEGQYVTRVVNFKDTDQLTFEGLQGEDASVSIHADGLIASGVFELEEGENEAVLELTPQRYRSIEIVDELGLPLEGMWVRLLKWLRR